MGDRDGRGVEGEGGGVVVPGLCELPGVVGVVPRLLVLLHLAPLALGLLVPLQPSGGLAELRVPPLQVRVLALHRLDPPRPAGK